jgi:DNA-binding beta-propeller fold protein YncE
MNKLIIHITLAIVFFVTIFIVGCEERISTPTGTVLPSIGDTSYVEKNSWTGIFNKPRTIIYGLDQLLYVTDTENNRIVMLNQAGQILSVSKTIRKPIAIAQDLKLDLLVGAETIEPATGDTIGIVLRIKLVDASHNLNNAKIDTVWKEPARPKRRFVGIGIILNNEYLVMRDGPDNSSIVDPDARVLRFRYRPNATTKKDSFITPLGELQSGAGSSVTNINHPTGIATFPNSGDFIVTQNSDGVQYSAIWMAFTKNNDFEGWLPKFDPTNPDHRSIEFISPNRFKNAAGVSIDRIRRDIFVVDSQLDSVSKFNNRGKFKVESFGKKTLGITLNHPGGSAIAENTLYVCDTQNNRIVLYRLSTDN